MDLQPSHAAPTTPSSASVRRGLDPQKGIIVLAACMALQMTGYAIVLPLFARRFREFGSGVKALGTSDMVFALTSIVSAPIMGALADRYGRRPIIIGSLAAHTAAFFGLLLAPNAEILIVVRGIAGAFTVGLLPAVTGLTTDIAPEDRRAQWIGFVIGGASIGWVAGPILGGVLYDRFGYSTALIVSIALTMIAFLIALAAVPESQLTYRHASSEITDSAIDRPRKTIKDHLFSLRSTLPKSITAFFIILFIYFAVMFAWAFMGPQYMFYAYNDLSWSSTMLGLVMGAYGVSMMLGEFGLGRLSDRFGRKPIITIGLVLFSAQFIGLAFYRSYILIAIAFLIAGFGNALYDPALTASILDISPAEHRARILGIKFTASSIGSILGPMLLVLVTTTLSSSSIFLAAFGVVVLAIVASFTIRIKSQLSTRNPDQEDIYDKSSFSKPIEKTA